MPALLGGCALTGLGQDQVIPLVTVQGPEALVAASNGRLFVTGRQGVYELTEINGTVRARRLPTSAALPAGCQFTGASVQSPWLFTVCTLGDRSYLLRGRLAADGVRLDQLAPLPGVAIASGLATKPGGTLWVADSRPDSTAITRITGAMAPAFRPRTAVWLDTVRGGFPNGLQYHRGRLFLTSAGHLLAIDLDADGAPGEIRTIATRLTFLDDFQVLPSGGFLVTDYSFNRLVLLSPQGLELGTFGHGLQGPTATLLLPGDDGGDPAVLVSERDRAAVSRVPVPRRLLPYLGGR